MREGLENPPRGLNKVGLYRWLERNLVREISLVIIGGDRSDSNVRQPARDSSKNKG